MNESNFTLDPKIVGIISHFSIVGWFIAFVSKKDDQETKDNSNTDNFEDEF